MQHAVRRLSILGFAIIANRTTPLFVYVAIAALAVWLLSVLEFADDLADHTG
jgi:hypothetical protein